MSTKAQVLIGILAFCMNVVTSSPYVVTYDEPQPYKVIPSMGRPLLGAKLCTRGPAYWCHNITQAKECGAVSHCIKKVWEPMQLPTDNDTICDLCKEMVKEARDQLLSNETQDELRQVFEGSCKLIPLKIISSECRKLADEFIPELVETLASRMDPQVVCAVSGLCNSNRIDEMLGKMKEIEDKTVKFELLSDDSCPKCAHYIGEGITYFKKLTKKDLLYKLFEVCGHFGSFSDSCRAMASEDIDQVYAFVQNELNATELCGLVGLCEVVSLYPVKIQEYSTGVGVWSPPLRQDYQCDFCKQLVAYLKRWFTTDTTKEEFNEIAVGLCKQTRKYKDECLNLVKEYGDLVYNLIVEELDPEKACIFIESCNTTKINGGRHTLFSSASNPAPLWTILQPADMMEMTKLEPAELMTGDDERASHQPGFSYPLVELTPAEKLTGDDESKTHQPGFTYPMTQLTPAEKLTGNDELTSIVSEQSVRDILPTCGICTFTITKLIDLIGKNMTKASIDAAMEEVCYLIPSSKKEGCLTFMREYGDKVAEMIILEGTAHGVCIALHLCLLSPAPTMHKAQLVGEALLPLDFYVPYINNVVNEDILNETVEEKPTCPLCEFVLMQLDSMLKDNATESEVKDTVEQICHYLPRTVRDECRHFIDEYGDEIIQYLIQQLDPKGICVKIKLCNGKIEDSLEVLFEVDEVRKTDRCQLCMLISDYLSAFLADSTVDISIEKLVERVCPLLANHETECKELIEDYGPYILSLLSQETDKGQACAAVNLCPAATTTTTAATLAP